MQEAQGVLLLLLLLLLNHAPCLKAVVDMS
jgi:hypothetical protein